MTASVSGKRQLDGHAPAAIGLERNAPADVLDIAADHVHADAAAGYVGDLFRGREAGQEDEIVDLIVAERSVRAYQPAVARLLQHTLGIDTGAVVLDLDDDAAAAMLGREPDRAFFGLACSRAIGRRLDAVIDRVADDMGQRIAEAFDDRAIDFGVFARQFQLHLLGGLYGELAHEPRHALEHGIDLLRAHRHHAVLELARVMRDFFEHLRQPAADIFRQAVNHLSQAWPAQ